MKGSCVLILLFFVPLAFLFFPGSPALGSEDLHVEHTPVIVQHIPVEFRVLLPAQEAPPYSVTLLVNGSPRKVAVIAGQAA